MKYGYVRENSFYEDLNKNLSLSPNQESFKYSRQYDVDWLKKEGVMEKCIRVEENSGSLLKRSTFSRLLLKECQKNDEILVTYFDRFAQSTLEVLKVIHFLQEREIKLVPLDVISFLKEREIKLVPLEKYDLVFSELFFTNIIYFLAEFEKRQREIKQMQGIAKAKSEGKYKGRPLKLTEAKKKRLKELILSGNLSKKEIMDLLNLSRTTFYRGIKQLKLASI